MATSQRHRAYAGLVWNGVAAATIALAQFAFFLTLARFLRPEEVGQAASALVITNLFLSFADGGFGALIVRNRNLDGVQLTSLFWITVAIGLAICAFVVAASPFIMRHIGHEGRSNLLAVMALVFPLAGAAATFQAVLQRELCFRQLAVADGLGALVMMTTGVLSLAAGVGPLSVAIGVLVGQMARAGIAITAGSQHWRPSRLVLNFSRLEAERRFALYQVGERFVSNLNFYADQLVATVLLGPLRFGYYSFAANLATVPIYRLNSIANRAAYPLLCSVQDDSVRLRRAYLQLVRLVSTVNFPLLIGMAASAHHVVPVAFGSKWAAAVPVVQLLCVASLARTICNPVSSLVLACGRADLGFRWNLSISVLCLGATWVGAIFGGLYGVAVAQAAVYLLLAVGLYVVVVRKLLGACAIAYIRAFTPALLGAGVVAAIVWLADRSSEAAAELPVLLSTAAFAGVAYVTVLWIVGPEYRHDVREAWRWVRSHR